MAKKKETKDTEGFIEIPFGAFDSETIGWTYTIPEGFTAKIEDGKIMVEKKEIDDEKIRKEIKILYSDIDTCISKLLKARTDKDAQTEGRALFEMEGLMVATLQDLSCIEDYLEKYKDFQFNFPGIYFYDGEKLHFQGNPAMEEKQKEQKPDFIVPESICPKFAVGDTVCRPMWSDHTIREIYINCNDPVYVCVNDEGLESHIPFSEQDEWEKKEQKTKILIPKFQEGDMVISTKNNHLTYKILEVGHINELGNPDYKVEIFTDGKPDEPRNIKYIEIDKMDSWGELIEQKSTEQSEEDEKIMESLLRHFKKKYKTKPYWNGIAVKDIIVYLEKQKAKDSYDRMAPIYENRESFESALDKAWKFYDESGCSTVDGCEDNAFELAFAKGFREGFLFGNQQKSAEWSEDYREEDLRTRFAFYTYKDEDGVLYLSNVFVEETSRNKGFGAKILQAAEKVAETIGAITIRLKAKQDSPANAWYRKHGYGYMAFEDGYDWLEKTLEYLKPARKEWGEEDEKDIQEASGCLRYFANNYAQGGNSKLYLQSLADRIESLHPQPKAELDAVAEKEAYKDGFLTARYNSANAFMQYLDEHRPEGKMCLSNGECKDINKAFEVGDWAKIIRYVNKYQPHWKPSEVQMDALAWYSGNSGVPPTGDKAIKSLYDDLKKL